MLDKTEGSRLKRLYEDLRIRLLDLSKRNQLLNYRLGPRSKRHLRIVDCSLEDIHRRLVGEETAIQIAPLPEPDDIPSEERTDEFRSALDRARATDDEYLTAVEAIDADGIGAEAMMEKLERQLRDRIRKELGLPPRPSRKELNRADYARELGIEPSFDLEGETLGNGLQTLKFPDELEAVMEKISGDARLAEQEMGLSTLFIAFGFLEWYDSDTSDKKSYAPLLLLPVQIAKQKIRGKPIYSLLVREGGAEANLSLQKLLEQSFSRRLPDFVSSEEDGVSSIEAYLSETNAAIDGLKRWKIRRWLVLGHFSFGRFAMYADLELEKWKDPIEHPLVGPLLRGSETKYDEDSLPHVAHDYEIDDPIIEAIAPFLVQDADASQHSALVDVMKGTNLVIQGPPGTGKSQTITNIIAGALAAGKRVLFLAEKQAALEVVKRRLDSAGLGDFCLEVHSDKVSPRSVVKSLADRWDLGTGITSSAAIQQVDLNWLKNREEITSYLRALHANSADGSTPFELIWQSLRGRTTHADVVDTFKDVKIPTGLIETPQRLSEVTGELGILAGMAQAFTSTFGHPGRSLWSQITFTLFPAYDVPRFIEALAALMGPTMAAQDMIASYEGLGIASLNDFAMIANIDCKLSDSPEIGVLVAIRDLDLEDLEKALAIRIELLRIDRAFEPFPHLRHDDPERLAVAETLMRSTYASAFSNHVPASAYAFAEREASLLAELVDIAESAVPALTGLGLASNSPASVLPTAAAATFILSSASEIQLSWMFELSHTLETEVASVMGRWRVLVDAEQLWKATAKGYQSLSRPSVDDLEGAKRILLKRGVSKLFTKINGSIRVARALCHQIGIDESPKTLDALATHIASVRRFESDDSLSRMFGPAWRGIDTPIEAVRDVIRFRDQFRKTLLDLPGGDHVLKCATTLSVSRLSSLSSYRSACKRLLDLAPEVKARLVDQPIDRFIADASLRTATLHHFLSIDPRRILADIPTPINQIAHAHTLLKRAERARAALAECASATHAISLGSSAERVAAAIQAIKWVRLIRSLDIKPKIKTQLLSHEAGTIREAIREAAKGWSSIETQRKSALEHLREFGADAIGKKPPADLLLLIEDLTTRGQELADYIALRQLRRRLEDGGLENFLSACDRHALDPGRMPSLFAVIVAIHRAAAARRATSLTSSNGAALDARRRAFAERDRAKISSDRRTIRARLLKEIPPAGTQSGPRKTWTGMKLLANEFPKMKRFTPVRQLLARAGSTIQSLKPCFMMSPISLAKFVAPQSLTFDLLVIDEASQMRPEDALGGMLRAKQIVVVGDAKQLPPTDFFFRADSHLKDDVANSEEGDDDDDLDAESILEACETTFRERRRLKWHYRSRCESLIAFSNRTFYNDTLITFPAARPGLFSVKLVRADGIYRARRNPAEAAKVAEEAITFMRHFASSPEETIPTIGIVTVNVEQREFIDEELRRLWADDELVETYLEKVRSKGEPFFVKNLENVQGDERDHIFVSLTYGRKHGEPVLSQNFGPINRRQGHRRLNVLFTRARIRMAVFSSFGSTDVRPTDSSSEGVRALKAYLEYAETQGRAVVRAIGGEADSDFELEVAERLRMRGYNVDLQVGVSAFRLDLGIRHPDFPERFLAGVECDGAAFHSSKSARDRDRLREEVLGSLGWRIFRVWSTDWFDNPALETDKLVRKLEELRQRNPSPFESYPPIHDDVVVGPHNEADSVEPKEKETASQWESPPRAVDVEFPASASSEGSTVAAESAQPSTALNHADLLAGHGRLTSEQGVAALEVFREQVIRPSMSDWDAQRSILRPAMIETFVEQQVADPAEWHTRVPQYLRTGTNPAEKSRFLEDICEIVARIGSVGIQRPLPFAPISENQPKATVTPSAGSRVYAYAEPTRISVPDRVQFFEPRYNSTLKSMIEHVIEVEGPIFEDVLTDRIARAHGLMRSGNQIRNRVAALLPFGVARTDEGDRKVIWQSSSASNAIHGFRKDLTGRRQHEDIPLQELAAVALPFVRLRMEDEAVLRKMAEEFSLGRLRQATRTRFEAALRIARQSVSRP